MGEIVGAVISVISLAAGYGLGRMRRSNLAPKTPKLECSCNHGLSFHDKKTSRCHGWSKMIGYEPDQCTCRQYDGPVPYDTYVARELT